MLSISPSRLSKEINDSSSNMTITIGTGVVTDSAVKRVVFVVLKSVATGVRVKKYIGSIREPIEVSCTNERKISFL
jgi:hypothetical protein